MRSVRSRSFALLLLFCLLFGQWAAGVHTLSHLPPLQASGASLDAPDDEGRGAPHVCLECLTGQALGMALQPAGLVLGAGGNGEVADTVATAPVVANVWLLARSRAPPTFL